MNFYTSPAAINARIFLRRFGLARCLQRLMNTNKSYEEAFESNLVNMVHESDCVWDIGANIGRYTEKLSKLVESTGQVVAFEPSPLNFSKLKENCCSLNNIMFRSEALGDESGHVRILQGQDDIGATSRVAKVDAVEGDYSILAKLDRGDALVQSGTLPMPNVIKVDTEGFEVEVLRGLEGLLLRSELRAIGMEVHFGILAQRGLPHAPAEMEVRLKRAGFAIRWVDPSHMIASR